MTGTQEATVEAAFDDLSVIIETARQLAENPSFHAQRLAVLGATDYYRYLIRRFGERTSYTEILNDDVLYRRIRYFSILFPRLGVWHELSKDLTDQRNKVAHTDDRSPDKRVLQEALGKAEDFRKALVNELADHSKGSDLSAEIKSITATYRARAAQYDAHQGKWFHDTEGQQRHATNAEAFERIADAIAQSGPEAHHALLSLLVAERVRLEEEFEMADSEGRAMAAEAEYEAWKDAGEFYRPHTNYED
jgi:hypothetical protein